MAEPIVGIDLGTTFSVIAYLDPQGRPVTVVNAEGELSTPSAVFLDPAGAVVGTEALKAGEAEPERLASYPKRDMGRDAYHQPVRGEQLPPEVLQALILRKLKADAEARLGPLRQAVITVPAYFNEPRRKATQDAGRMAGWEVLDILNEPTAAAIAYGVQSGFLAAAGAGDRAETFLVYDLGGGTFDVTLMRIEGKCFSVLGTAGDVELGGLDWNQRLLDHVADKFNEQFGTDPRSDHAATERLRAEVEQVKRSLSARPAVTLSYTFAGHHLRLPITREEFEGMTGDLLDRTAWTLRRLMREARLNYSDLTRLLISGGATRMPMVTALLEQETGLAVDRSLSPDEAVAHGAAIYAHSLVRGDQGLGLTVRNVNAHDLGVLGVEKSTGKRRRHIMIPRNTPLPATNKHRFTTFRDSQPSVAVHVVEGGDASGTGATQIGKCVVAGLPPKLPKNTVIEVTFRYTADGRLEVQAAMPAIDKSAKMTIERATGMPEKHIAAWAECVEAGLPDGYTRPGSAAPAPPPPPPPPKKASTTPVPAVKKSPKTPVPPVKKPPTTPMPEVKQPPLQTAGAAFELAGDDDEGLAGSSAEDFDLTDFVEEEEKAAAEPPPEKKKLKKARPSKGRTPAAGGDDNPFDFEV
jgi:molecular chaperone DnaK